jgi:hypothetical protein
MQLASVCFVVAKITARAPFANGFLWRQRASTGTCPEIAFFAESGFAFADVLGISRNQRTATPANAGE